MNELINLPLATCRSEKYTNGLIDLISHIQHIETMVEVGSYQGESTAIFAKHLPNIKKLIAVDPWVNGYNQYDVCSQEYDMKIVEQNFEIRTMEFPFVIKQKMMSLDFVQQVEDESLDFVYIDGDHSYESCKQDIEAWLPKIKKGGVIGGHDYLAEFFMGVVNAVNERFGSPDKTFMDSSWIKFL